MSTIRTNLGNTRERARQLRFEPAITIGSTNVQKAIEEVEGDVQAIVTPVAGLLRSFTAAGNTSVSATEPGVAINKTVGGATTVQLPPASSRSGYDVIVKDLKGDADANNITILPDAGDVAGIDGNAQDLIDINKGSRKYKPITSGWVRT